MRLNVHFQQQHSRYNTDGENQQTNKPKKSLLSAGLLLP
jgi:hypothetical protein